MEKLFMAHFTVYKTSVTKSEKINHRLTHHKPDFKKLEKFVPVLAEDENDVKRKIELFYSNKDTDHVKHTITIKDIEETIK